MFENAVGTQVLSQVPLTQFISSDPSPPKQRGYMQNNDNRNNMARISGADITSY